ncbi:MAG TPA: polyprenyl synthetase family protein [Chloroflexota bacterium]|nr:polyprenyl synthetase family protein [Chloroflexota bacterium]
MSDLGQRTASLLDTPLAPPTNGAPLLAPIAADLAAVEKAIQGVADVDSPHLRETLRLILSAGGKRIRPALAVLAARLHENTLERRVELAVAAELLHTATLIHDDVLDESAARRGASTINALYGNTLAVLTGDYLFGKSGELVAGLDDPAIMGVFSWAVMELVKGEMLRPSLNGDLAATERDYLAKIRGKTASLFAMCCQTGAMLDTRGDRDDHVIAALRDYGSELGMAFQIADDVLDYTATEQQLGKPVGSDLRQGTITLPAIFYLRRNPGSAMSPVVRGLIDQDEEVAPGADEAVAAIRDSAAIAESLDRARAHADTAVGHLAALRPGPIVETLRRLAYYAVDRHD